MYGITSHFFRGSQGQNSGLLSGSRGGASMEPSSPAPLCPSLTGSFYTYSLKVSHLTSFPFTVARYMKQIARPTPRTQPLVPEKAFIHSHRQDRQTYSLLLCTVVLYCLNHVNLEDADLLILYLFLGLARLYGALATGQPALDFQRTKNTNIAEEGKGKHEHPEKWGRVTSCDSPWKRLTGPPGEC